MKTFRLPDLGEGLHEAEIVAWHVSVGDNVVADQPLVSVETDKAVVEIPSPRSGRITRLFGAPGDHIETGAELVEFEAGERADTGTVVGEIPSAAEPAPAAVEAPPRPARGVMAAPAVRALARRLGVDLTAVAPSGPEGRITTADVERAAATLAAAGPAEPLHGARRAMARNMTRAHAEVVPATVSDEADVDGWPPHTDVTGRLARAVVAGCRAAPALNAWYDGAEVARRLHQAVHLGIAMDTADGLFVPVLRDAAGRAPGELRDELERLKTAVRERTVRPEELRGATISLSNFGTLAGRFGTLVVVPPQVAILGVGRITPQVVARDGEAVVCRLLPLSLTFDHRVVTGGEAARFLKAVIEDLERSE